MSSAISQLMNHNTLKEAREAKGLSQSALAKEAGISQATVSHLETGVYAGSMTSLSRVAAVLGLTLDDAWRLARASQAARAAEAAVEPDDSLDGAALS